MITTIEHVRHLVTPESVISTMRHADAPPVMLTACGRRFLGLRRSTRDTRHHEPATSRCPECWR